MHVVEKNEKILCEYGRAIILINSVEFLFTNFLALEKTKINNSSMATELNTLEGEVLGCKIRIFNDSVIPRSNNQAQVLNMLYNKICKMNDYRISLVHVVSAETGTTNKNKEWIGDGCYILVKHNKRDGTIVPERALNKAYLKKISTLAKDIQKNIYQLFSFYIPKKYRKNI